MNRRIIVEPEFAAALSAAPGGEGIIDALLDDETPDRRCAGLGKWTPLIKPGLGGRERWRWELPNGMTLFVKRYRKTPLREQYDRFIHQSWLHSRAWWEYEQSAYLRRGAIPSVHAVAAAELMLGPWERRSAVVFKAAPGEALDRAWPRLAAAGSLFARGAARHAIARALGRFVSAFHAAGVCHRDLYLCHIFADLERRHASESVFTLIDLGRTFRPLLRRMRWVIKDLSQLDASARQIGLRRTDRLRCLMAYLGLDPRSPRTRTYVRRILRRSNAILRRDARKRGGR